MSKSKGRLAQERKKQIRREASVRYEGNRLRMSSAVVEELLNEIDALTEELNRVLEYSDRMALERGNFRNERDETIKELSRFSKNFYDMREVNYELTKQLQKVLHENKQLRKAIEEVPKHSCGCIRKYP